MAAIDIAKGIEILVTLNPEADTNADHDVIYCEGPHPMTLPIEIVKRLNELGWNWDNDIDAWRHFT